MDDYLITHNFLPENYTGNTVNILQKCFHCAEEYEIILSTEQTRQWKQEGKMIQNAFPHLTNTQREMMMTGLHPKCFDNLFPEE